MQEKRRVGQIDSSELSDSELWALLQQNECAALSTIFDRYGQTIFRYCVRRLGDRSGAEDLLTVVFLEAWHRRDERIEYGTLRSFLYGITTKAIAHRGRHLRRHRKALKKFRSSVDCDQPVPNKATAISNELLMECLDTFLAMPRPLQDVVSLCVWEELSTAEVAAALGVEVETVQIRLDRAKRRLAEGDVVFRRSGRVS